MEIDIENWSINIVNSMRFTLVQCGCSSYVYLSLPTCFVIPHFLNYFVILQNMDLGDPLHQEGEFCQLLFSLCDFSTII